MLELRAVINGDPLAFTVRIKHSFQRGPSNGLNGDFGSFGKRSFRIVAPGAFGHEVQFARGCSIFHSFARVSIRGNDCERLLDFDVTV